MRCMTSLSPAERMRLHRAVAEALEAIHAAELEPHVAELAHHYFLATPAASASAARGYAVRAAERATAELAYEEAARLYEIAVEGTRARARRRSDHARRADPRAGRRAGERRRPERGEGGRTPGPRTSRAVRATRSSSPAPRSATEDSLVALPADDRRERGADRGGVGRPGRRRRHPARAAPRSPRVCRPEAAVELTKPSRWRGGSAILRRWPGR